MTERTSTPPDQRTQGTVTIACVPSDLIRFYQSLGRYESAFGEMQLELSVGAHVMARFPDGTRYEITPEALCEAFASFHHDLLTEPSA